MVVDEIIAKMQAAEPEELRRVLPMARKLRDALPRGGAQITLNAEILQAEIRLRDHESIRRRFGKRPV
jgi:hypothetical protein